MQILYGLAPIITINIPIDNYTKFYIIVNVKLLKFSGSALNDLRDFPEDARREAGFELYNVQSGVDPSDWKPMPSIGAGVREIRIHERGEYRIIYIAKFEEAVYVLHAFQKKTQKTRQSDIEMAKARYKEIGRK